MDDTNNTNLQQLAEYNVEDSCDGRHCTATPSHTYDGGEYCNDCLTTVTVKEVW